MHLPEEVPVKLTSQPPVVWGGDAAKTGEMSESIADGECWAMGQPGLVAAWGVGCCHVHPQADLSSPLASPPVPFLPLASACAPRNQSPPPRWGMVYEGPEAEKGEPAWGVTKLSPAQGD